MLFGLLFVLPIAVIAWLLVKLVRPKTRISFENVHQAIYCAIALAFGVGFILAIIGTAAYQIFWYHPWVLAILAVSWSGIGLVSLIGHLAQKARQRRQGQTAT
jgi:hypothetical protein